MLRIAVLLALWPSMYAWAGADAGQAGAFLRQEASGRSAAMAGAVTAVVDDASALLWNPAGLSRLGKPEVNASHVILFEDTQYDLAAAGVPTRWGGFAAGYVRQASGGFERRTTPADAATEFSIAQTAFLAGWGKGWALPWRPSWVRDPHPLEVGLSVKSVRETIDTAAASGSGADLGLVLRPDPRYMLGVSYQNVLAPSLTFVRRPVRYPRVLDVSPAVRFALAPEISGLAALRLSKMEDRSLDASGGVELDYRIGALRFGMNGKGMSTGVGLRLGNTQFDYAVLLHALGLSHTLSFIQRFGQTPEELEDAIRKGISKLNRAEAQRLSRAYLRSAELKRGAEKLTEALKDLEAAALWDPDNAQIPARIETIRARMQGLLRQRMVVDTAALARGEYERGNLLASRQYWKAVLEALPEHEEARAYLARIEARLSEDDRSSAAAMRRREEAREVQRLFDAAQSRIERGELRSALSLLEQAAQLDPADARTAERLIDARKRLEASVRERVAQARAQAESGRCAEALQTLSRVRADAPGDAEAEKVAGACRGALGRPLTAEEAQKVERLYYQAVDHYLRGRFRDARSLTEQVLAVDPASDPARRLKEKVDAALSIEAP